MKAIIFALMIGAVALTSGCSSISAKEPTHVVIDNQPVQVEVQNVERG